MLEPGGGRERANGMPTAFKTAAKPAPFPGGPPQESPLPVEEWRMTMDTLSLFKPEIQELIEKQN